MQNTFLRFALILLVVVSVGLMVGCSPYTPEIRTPQAPSGVFALETDSDEITVGWTDNSNDEYGFILERRVESGSFFQIATLGSNQTSYIDSGLSPDTLYTYRVKSYNGAGQSGYSNYASCEIDSGTIENPSIEVSTTSISRSISLGSTASTQSFSIGNSGTGTLSYSVSDNVGWLSCSPTSGSCTVEQDSISVVYSTSGLSLGSHSGTIYVNSSNASNSPQAISVTVNVSSSDSSPPSNCSISIDSGETYATSSTVVLSLHAEDENGIEMQLMNDSGSWTSWVAFQSSYPWNLNGAEGTRTVNVRFRDASGNTTTSYYDTIIVDSVAPSVPSDLSVNPSGVTAFDIDWSASSDGSGSGIAEYKVYRSNYSSSSKYLIGTTSNTSLSYNQSSLSYDTKYYFFVESIDNAGNPSGYTGAVVGETGGVLNLVAQYDARYWIYVDDVDEDYHWVYDDTYMLVKFDLPDSSHFDGKQIQIATLDMSIKDYSASSDSTTAACRILEGYSWRESFSNTTILYDSTPSVTPYHVLTGGYNKHRFNVKDIVKDWANGVENNGFFLRQTSSGYDATKYYSKDYTVSAQKPSLEVWYY